MARSRIKDQRRVDDYWSKKARTEKYPARSVFKLEEADRKYGLLKAGQRVLDLGCSPGSWTLYAAKKVGPAGLVVGVDLNKPEISFPSNAEIIQADVFEMSTGDLVRDASFDLVLSDMAPKTTGNKSVDQTRSVQLARAAFDLCADLLKPGGVFYVKVFTGPEVDDFFKLISKRFKTVRRFKPKSSRSFSPEIFGLGLGFF